MSNLRAYSVERIAFSKKKKSFLSFLSAKRYPLNAKSGFTLIELVIAITLMSMVLLSIVAVDIASRKFFHSADIESRVQNEVNPALERIAKDASQGYGTKIAPGVRVPLPNTTLEIRQLDSNPSTYEDFTDDQWVAYNFSSNTITRYNCTSVNAAVPFECNGWSPSGEVIARNIVGCVFTPAPDNSSININITARRDATSGVNATNPEVNSNTTVALRFQSVN